MEGVLGERHRSPRAKIQTAGAEGYSRGSSIAAQRSTGYCPPSAPRGCPSLVSCNFHQPRNAPVSARRCWNRSACPAGVSGRGALGRVGQGGAALESDRLRPRQQSLRPRGRRSPESSYSRPACRNRLIARAGKTLRPRCGKSTGSANIRSAAPERRLPRAVAGEPFGECSSALAY